MLLAIGAVALLGGLGAYQSGWRVEPKVDNGGPRLWSSGSEGDVAFKQFILQPGQFTNESLAAISQSLLANNPNKKIVLVDYYASEDAARSELTGKGTFHTDVEQWLAGFQAKHQSQPGPRAQLLRVHGSATLRIVHESGGTSEFVLQGKNVFHWEVEGNQYHLLHVGQGSDIVNGIEQMQAVFFFRSSSCVDASRARRLLSHTIVIAGTSQIQIHVSPDSWFTSDVEYPTYNVFDPRKLVPSAEQVANTVQTQCFTKPTPNCLELPPHSCKPSRPSASPTTT
jgi:hypothetical protein